MYYSYTYNHHRITVRHICASDVWKLYISMLTFISLDFLNNMYNILQIQLQIQIQCMTHSSIILVFVTIHTCVVVWNNNHDNLSWLKYIYQIHIINICDIGCLIEHQVANIVNLNDICAITNCHSIYYSIILTFNGNYQKI